MSELEGLAARCLFPGFVGLEPPEWIRPWLDAGLGGVVLFSRNVRDREQLANLNGALRSERPDLLVAIDEEGGDVTRLEVDRGSSYPGNCALGVVDDVGLTQQVAAAIGADLAGVGVDLNLAPVADLLADAANPIVGVRSFGSDPDLVARHVAAFVFGLQGRGVAACVKHFPGHGDTSEDSHVALPTVRRDRAQLDSEDLVPFRAAIAAGVRVAMTAHVRVPAFEDVPATLSRVILTQVLRGELGFDGMVMTDALEMAAVSASVGVEEGAVRSLAAGADALCLGSDLGPDALEAIRRAVVEAVRSGRLGEKRLREASERVRETGSWVPSDLPGTDVDRTAGFTAARLAVRAEGRVELSRLPLVVELQPEPTIAADATRHGLGDAVRARLPECSVEVVRPGDDLPSVNGHQVVVVVRDAHRHEWQRAAAERLLAGSSDAVVVETGLPVWRPPFSAGYLATYGAGRVNLEAAAERLCPFR